MKFRTQFTPNINIGTRQCSCPCEAFSPGQGKTIAEVISDYVKGIPTDSVNLYGIEDPQRAEDALQVRTSRQLPIDDVYLHEQLQRDVIRLERSLTDEELKIAKNNS